MRKILAALICAILCAAYVGSAIAQPDCEFLIKDLQETLKKPGKFDLPAFLTKHGLEYTTCRPKNREFFCFKCLYSGSVSALEIELQDNGAKVLGPRYGCECARSH